MEEYGDDEQFNSNMLLQQNQLIIENLLLRMTKQPHSNSNRTPTSTSTSTSTPTMASATLSSKTSVPPLVKANVQTQSVPNGINPSLEYLTTTGDILNPQSIFTRKANINMNMNMNPAMLPNALVNPPAPQYLPTQQQSPLPKLPQQSLGLPRQSPLLPAQPTPQPVYPLSLSQLQSQSPSPVGILRVPKEQPPIQSILKRKLSEETSTPIKLPALNTAASQPSLKTQLSQPKTMPMSYNGVTLPSPVAQIKTAPSPQIGIQTQKPVAVGGSSLASPIKPVRTITKPLSNEKVSTASVKVISPTNQESIFNKQVELVTKRDILKSQHLLKILPAESDNDMLWRKLCFRGNATLHVVHTAIQVAFGWKDTLPHYFLLPNGMLIGKNAKLVHNERKVALSQIVPTTDFYFLYIYGDLMALRVIHPFIGNQDSLPSPRLCGGVGISPSETEEGGKSFEKYLIWRKVNESRLPPFSVEQVNATFLGEKSIKVLSGMRKTMTEEEDQQFQLSQMCQEPTDVFNGTLAKTKSKK